MSKWSGSLASHGSQLGQYEATMGTGTQSGAAAAPSGEPENPIMPQAIVTTRTRTSDSLLAERQATVNLAPEHRYGTVGTGEEIYVLPLEGVLVPRNSSARGRNSLPGIHAQAGITSLTGIRLMNGVNEEDLVRSHYFLGFARTSYIHGRVDQPKNGFTTQIAGSGSAMHNGDKHFNIGDTGMWGLPPTNMDERERFFARRKAIPGRHPGKMTPVFTPFDHRLITGVMRRSVEWLLDAGVEDDERDVNLLDHPSVRLTFDEELGLSQKRSLLANTLFGVCRLAERGMITINAPGLGVAGASPNDRANYDLWAAAEEVELPDIYAEQLVFDNDDARGDVETARSRGNRMAAGGGGKTEHMAALEQRRESALWLANKLGLTPHDERKPHIAPAERVVESIVGTALAPLSSNADEQRVFSVQQMLGLADEDVYQRRTLGNQRFLNTPLAALVKTQDSAAKQLAHAYAQADAELRSRQIGIITSVSRPGEQFDWVR